jgi:hypothetical protein
MNLTGIGKNTAGVGCGAWRLDKGTIGFLLGGRISDTARLRVLVPALRELY